MKRRKSSPLISCDQAICLAGCNGVPNNTIVLRILHPIFISTSCASKSRDRNFDPMIP
ncbi:MAG: hypothetical protein ACI9S8_003297, partial [Chlamydiales bacterium]